MFNPTDENEDVSGIKCGEMFIIKTAGNYSIVCQFCGLECSNFDKLAAHVFDHLPTPQQEPSLNIKQENFISCGSDNDEHSAEACYDDEDDNKSQNAASECPSFPTKCNTNNEKANRSEKEITNDDKMALQCKFCDKKFTASKSRLDHENLHTGHQPYECTICSKKYSVETSLRNHLHAHAKKEGKQERAICTVCGKSLSDLRCLNIHIRENHLEDEDPRRLFKCKLCDCKFDKVYHLSVHRLTHQKITSPYVCDYCKREYKFRKNIVSHMYKVHSNLPKIHNCGYCPMSFRTRTQRDDHENSAHTRKRPYQCLLCSLAFTSKSNLRRHTKYHHKNPNKTETTNSDGEDSKRKIVQKKYLPRKKAQLLSLIETRPAVPKGSFGCNFCTAIFRREEKRDLHLNKHTGKKPYECTMCPKSFYSSPYLVKHMKTHLSAEEKARNSSSFACNICSKIYRRKKELDHHIFSHTGKSPFRCEFCQKVFLGPRHLNRHIKDGTKYTCKDKPIQNDTNLTAAQIQQSSIVSE